MNNLLFKDLTAGATIYALIKADELEYKEGSVVNVGMQRMEMPQGQATIMPNLPRHVVDVTYAIDGKNYTDTIGIADALHQTTQFGGVSLIATDKDAVIRELRATLKVNEDYLANVQVETQKRKKQAEQCKELIAKLDVAFAEKQQMESRIKRLEDSSEKTNTLLEQILAKMN